MMRTHIAGVAAALALATAATVAKAQPEMRLHPLEHDTAVVRGTLPNGLTYIIRRNTLPKNTAEFYIAQKVGAVLEEDDQDGLAHFLEHMAFNGTKNFPGKGIINFLERVGVRFGENVNAFTSLDETVYNLSAVPTTDPAIVDSALLALHDWSGFISLDGDEIDKERGVIREEWRTRANASRRMYFAHMANTMPGTRYAVRDVIGDTAVINNFSHDALRAYYRKWYRPDLQGIIVVGDIDPKAIEARIRDIWADIPAPADPAKREYFDVALNTAPVFSILRDKEATRTTVQIQYRYKPVPDSVRNTVEYYGRDIVASLACQVFNTRMRDLMQKGAPMTYAALYDTDNVPTLNMVVVTFAPQNGKSEEATRVVMDEVEKLRRFGVNPGELRRAADNLIKRYDDAYENRLKERSDDYVVSYYNAFLNNDVITSTAYDRELVRAIVPNVGVEAVNAYIAEALAPQPVFQISAIDNDGGIKDADYYLALIDDVRRGELTAYEDEAVDTRLMDKEPKGGKVKRWADDKVYGARVATLSNGIRVFLKPTTFDDNSIMLRAVSRGGFSTLPSSLATSAALSGQVGAQMGLGKFSSTDLAKALTGKSASVGASMNLYTDRLSGGSSKADFETMMQLVYLTFTPQRRDDDAFRSYYGRLETYLANADKNPDNIFANKLYKIMAGGNPYNVRLGSSDDLKALTVDGTVEAKDARFASARGFDFIIVGSFDIDSVMPAVCKWIGGLPTGKRQARWTARDDYMPQRDTSVVFSTPMTTEKVSFARVYSHKHAFDRREQIALTILKRCLDMRYLESVREELGGSYGVSVSSGLSNAPTEEYSLLVSFDTDPAKFDQIEPIIEQEIRTIAEQGPRADDLDKVKKNLVKARADALQDNGTWVGLLDDLILYGLDDSKCEEMVESMTPADVQGWARRILDEAHQTTVIMKPEK